MVQRLDQWLVEQGHFESREKARQAIVSGRVYHAKSGAVLDKAGMRVPAGLEVRIPEKERFVSRGGEKLDHFISETKIEIRDQICLDIGSSTGGFTDCLLQRGAKLVWAIDVGTHQLHEKLRSHPQIKLFEQTDIRSFDFKLFDQKPSIITIDVAFISVRLILPVLEQNLKGAQILLLFKPQFEAGRFIPKKKGVVSDENRKICLDEFKTFLADRSLQILLESDSALKGKDGNQETFFLIKIKD